MPTITIFQYDYRINQGFPLGQYKCTLINPTNPLISAANRYGLRSGLKFAFSIMFILGPFVSTRLKPENV